MNLVIVESPAKAKTINKYLGSSYEVLASYGHVRDLPAKNGSVDPDANFQMVWENDPKAAGRLNEIAKALKEADKLILATDPDREGEAISWHVLEIMKQKRALKDQKIERVVFNAITKQAVTEAMQHPRQIDGALVDAYLARRALDYLVGFTLSPVLWRKLPGARSAGRVQSVALRLVCDRELEIEKFVPREYWSLIATLATPRGESFEARLVGADGKKIQRLDIGTGQEAEDFKKALESANFSVTTLEAKPARRNPQAPFTTSTLQQEASRKLGFAPSHTMRIAQRLYEGINLGGETTGLITYMRTDGVSIDPSAITQARKVIGEDYGNAYVPDAPRQYTSKAKNAQEAHEAIRPTDVARRPAEMKRHLDNDQARLYELIWMRTVASQMESAELERTTVDITAKAGARTLELRATGQVVKFDGFLAVYQEGRDDDPDDEDSRRLPAMSEGESLKRENLAVTQHFTEPPPRYSEASLVKRMEELGIGRPSTYASILQVLKDRGYVKLDKKRLYAEDKGRVVVAFLENYFARYVEFDFTADLEEKLDLISNNEISWKQVLTDFWKDFIGAVNEIKDVRVTEVLDVLDAMLGEHIYEKRADGGDPRQCPSCGTGKLNLKAGKFGAFVGCSNYPECRYTRPLAASSGASDRSLGKDPETGLEVAVKAGRFGPYIQLGDAKDYAEDEKPKRAGIPKNMSPGDVELELALKLLSLPRDVGPHPEDGEMIVAGIGRFGPFVRHGKTYASLEAGDEVYTVGLNRAVTLIAEKIAKGPSRRFGADPGTAVGEYPARGGTIMRKKGRYGAYVTIDGINATIPDSIEPEKLTLEEAIALIEERAAKGGKAKRAAKRPTPAKNAARSASKGNGEDKPAADKTPAKKAAAKKSGKPATEKTETAPIKAAKPRAAVKAKKAPAPKVAAAKVAAAKTAPSAKKSAGKARG
ncbi:MAG: type I DNA topoisomerase [Bradyrhizobiaceae bacterium]|nr:MAG: type I DNA topoisomerase [Bradyrhizobiaceae bacterium]